uniref:Uncharacterized protein n=1 Tax=Glossina austeni TaxID=7395 RepID=A0A1A9UEU0_GLOAU
MFQDAVPSQNAILKSPRSNECCRRTYQTRYMTYLFEAPRQLCNWREKCAFPKLIQDCRNPPIIITVFYIIFSCEAIKNAMQSFKNSNALEEMLEAQSEIEDDGDLDEENGDDVDEDYDEGNIDETFDGEDELYDHYHNDTTEELEEDEDFIENSIDETAYTTSQDFDAKVALLVTKTHRVS